MLNSINQIPQKEATTKEEKLLLGFLEQEAKRIGFGGFMVEFTIRDGRVQHMKCTEVNRTINIGGK